MDISKSRNKIAGKYKLTQQREVIFHTLNSYTGQHLSTEDIYEIVHEQYPKIGLATIYRTMELFSSLNIVQKLDFGDGCQRYELYSPHQHHHLLCISCGKIIEIKGSIANALHTAMTAMTAMTDFSVLNYQLYIHGYCKNCQAKQTHSGLAISANRNTKSRSNVV